MNKSLDQIVFYAFILFFSGVLAIGGASLFLVRTMLQKTYAIAEESHNVDFINLLHNKTFSLLLNIHHLMVRAEVSKVTAANELIGEINADIDKYLLHEAESPHPESSGETVMLKRLRQKMLDLRETANGLLDASNRRAPGENPFQDRMIDRHADEIEALVREVNRLHFEIIGRKVEKSRRYMSAVFNLYVVFSLTGLILLYSGYRLHSRHVVTPLKQLAAAAGRIAEGYLNVQVASDSRTEIGQLFRAFNTMVAWLQAHEAELVALNRDLERKVRERTQSLETTHAELLRFEKMAMLGQIATSVNHEVRTPLNTLYMNVQLIKRDLEGRNAEVSIERRAQQRSIFNRIAMVEGEVQRVSDMLEEFVRYARLAPPRLADLDLNRVVGYVAEMLRDRAEQSRVRLELSMSEMPVMARADENKLIQVLVNLCTNAFHAMPEGGSLRLTTADRGERVEIVVADTGVGIPEADLDNIFLPFFTSKASGLGFGLSIVRRVVEDHGGEITCKSRVGEGTEFTIRLPGLHALTNGAGE